MNKYGVELTPTDVGTRWNSGSKGFGDTAWFFSTPRLKFQSIWARSKEVQIGTQYNNDYSLRDAQKFDCLLWIVEIHSTNPIFSIMNDCYAEVYITTVNGESTSKAVRLPWKNKKEPPTSLVTNMTIPAGRDVREEYTKVFAYYYLDELRRNYVSPTIDIRKGVRNTLYFLLTFKESPHAYLMTMSEFATWSDNTLYGNIDGLSLALPLNSQYAFDIRFYRRDGRNRGKLRINVKSLKKYL
jgi:hypothetical protein